MTARLPVSELAALAAKPDLNRRERRAAQAYLRKRPDLIDAAKGRIGGQP